MTVLGGYLGAGKTTLLNELLTDGGAAERVAVVVNDFGAVGVDAGLVRSRGEDTIELANGCVCCSLRDGMGTVLARLRAMTPAPARVLLEVSGVGDPAAVAGWGEHPGFSRAGVVVCADASAVRGLARDRWVADTVRHQLAGADVVLLTKLDLVDDDAAAAVRGWIDTVAPGVPVLGDRAELTTRLRAGLPRRRRPSGAGDPHAAVHRSWTVAAPGRPPLAVVRRALADLPAEVVRVKGVMRTAEEPERRTVVQRAAGRVETRDDGAWPAGGVETPTLVVVTRGPADGGAAEPEGVTRLRRDLAEGRPADPA